MIKTLDITIWDRGFSFPVEYDCYKGESVTKEQTKALETFSFHLDWIANSKRFIEEFCKDQVMEDDENERKDNIFSYVMPEYILVKRDEEYPRIALMCKYRYDLEHGLAVVFSSDGTVIVGIQDIIL